MIIKVNDLSQIRSKYADEKIILTSGTFDLFHVGHLRYLQAVKNYGDIVVVMLSGDKRVQDRKGLKRPVIPESDRAEILDAIKCIDYVFIDPGKNYEPILESLNPNLYITDGDDNRISSILEKSKIVILSRQRPGAHESTSAIIDRISSFKD